MKTTLVPIMKAKVIISLGMLMTLVVIVMLSVHACAQVPADFQHTFDTTRFVATRADGKQVTQKIFQANTFSVPMPLGRFKIGVYTDNAKSIEAFVRFSEFPTDSVDTTSNPSLELSVTSSQMLVIVPMKFTTKRPIISDGAGTQTFMFQRGSYYYAYIRRTALNQTFRLDINQTSSNHIVLDPRPGVVWIYDPPSQTINVTVTPVFK